MLLRKKVINLTLFLALVGGAQNLALATHSPQPHSKIISKDQENVSSLAYAFAYYTLRTTPDAFPWAAQRTTGNAQQEPFRNTNPTGDQLLTYLNYFRDPNNTRIKLEKIQLYHHRTKAVTIMRINTFGQSSFGNYANLKKQKVWFVKIGHAWKIKNYYLLMVKETQNGNINITDDHQYVWGIKTYDSKGNHFPY